MSFRSLLLPRPLVSSQNRGWRKAGLFTFQIDHPGILEVLVIGTTVVGVDGTIGDRRRWIRAGSGCYREEKDQDQAGCKIPHGSPFGQEDDVMFLLEQIPGQREVCQRSCT